MSDQTLSLPSGANVERRETTSWVLDIALDAAHPFADASRIALYGVEEVSVGRGAARAISRDGARLRVELDDPFQSHDHFALRRDGGGWRLVDAGSKNGTRLAGVRTAAAPLDDGSVIEAGATFLVLRRARGPIADAQIGAPPPGGTVTLHPGLEADLAVVDGIARTTLPVLVRGESGSGKELAARRIHALSGRRGPLIAVNCGALPQGLIEVELFGARRGAFTGAVEDRLGLVRASHGGTLFLDEIGELPAAAQATLLRVLQDGEVRPLGASQAVTVDLRVVAATHRDLDALVEADLFRNDLATRLRGHELTLPPLRDRREDVGLICATLLRRIDGGERPRRRFEHTAARALFAHSWPGNVRELDHALRVAIARGGQAIALDDLPESVRGAAARRATTEAGPPRPRDDDDGKRERLLGLVDRHHGNVSAIARTLGTSRSQVRRLAARLGVGLSPERPGQPDGDDE